MPELLICPECASPAILVNFRLPGKFWVQCVRNRTHGCIQGPVKPTDYEAATAWNRIAGAVAERDALKAINDRMLADAREAYEATKHLAEPHTCPECGAPYRLLMGIRPTSWPAKGCPKCVATEPDTTPEAPR